jgi:SAM-dependent methyltransferase
MNEDYGMSDYNDRLRAELEHFRNIDNVHDLPEIFHVWSAKYVGPKIETALGFSIAGMEEFYAFFIRQYAAEHPFRKIRIVSIGAGNGDLELRVAGLLQEAGVTEFLFQCTDINPAMLQRGRDAAQSAQMGGRFEFLELDASQWNPTQWPYALAGSAGDRERNLANHAGQIQIQSPDAAI